MTTLIFKTVEDWEMIYNGEGDYLELWADQTSWASG